MSILVETSSQIAAHRYARWGRPLIVVTATAAALLVWLIARYGAGLSLRTPAFSSGRPASMLTPGVVVVVAGLFSLGGWALIEVIERRFHQPRRVWLTTGIVALGISLSAPLSGHGVSTPQRIALVCMHLVVGAVLILMFARNAPAVEVSGGRD